MKKLLLALLLVIQGIAFSQNTWHEKDSILSGRYFLSSFVIGEKAYAGLGSIDAEQRIYSDEMFRYDPTLDTWETMAPFPGGGRYAATAFTINGKGYICLGVGNDHMWRSDVWEFDPVTSQWTQKNDFPGGNRYHCASFVIGNKAYVCGGSYNAGYNYLNDLWCYDPASDTWTQKASLPTEHKAGGAGFALNGKGYIAGGAYSTDEPANDFYQYDPVTDSWLRLADLPSPRTGAVAFVIGHKAFLGAGTDLNNTYNTFWSYDFDAVMQTWIPVTSPPAGCSVRVAPTAFTIGETAYLLAGRSKPYDPYYDSGILLKDMWSFGDSTKPCPPPVARFVYISNFPELHLTDSSTTGTLISRLWDFGDGNTSTEQNPVHEYGEPGQYTVCLTVTDSCGSDTSCQLVELYEPMIVTIHIQPSVTNDRAVQFSDKSVGTTRWLWNFGDGTTSAEQSPLHTYREYGTYQVCLKAGNNQFQGTTCESLLLTVVPSLHADNPVLVYPNPSQGKLWIRFFSNYPGMIVTISDRMGRSVYETTITSPDLVTPAEIDLGSLVKGLYFLKLSSEGFSKTWKVVLQ